MKPHLQITIATLLAHGASQHEIARRTGVDRKTIRRYAQTANSPMATGSQAVDDQIPPPRPPAPSPARRRARPASRIARGSSSRCAQGRNAMAIYQDLVDQCDFAHRYNSVKRFVGTLKHGPRALRRAGERPRRGSAGRLRARRTDTCPQRQVPPPAPVRDDAQVLGQELPQGGLESRSGNLGTPARGGVPQLRWRRVLRRARQPQAGRDPPRSLRAATQSGVCRAARALRRRGRPGPRRGSRSQGHRGERDPAHPVDGVEGAALRVDRGAERLSRTLGGALGRPASTAARSARCWRCSPRSART